MAGIKDYSTTASNNSSVGGVNIAEGMLPSNINNAFRAITADVREWYNDAQWVIYGDGDGAHTCTYVSGTSFKIVGANVTSIYEANRRIKAIGSSTGTIFGTISSSTFSSDTTVNVTWDSGSLQNESLVIYVAILSASNTSIPLGVVTGSMLSSGLLVSNSAHASHTPNDTTVFTTSASDSRYFRQDSTETIASGDAWSNSDTKVATTAAVSNRIIDLVDDVGGFVPIANETSFPNANPDVNNGTGTIVSITALSTDLTSNSSGVITIANGTLGNSTVTLNNCGNAVTFASGFGLLVETTTTLNTYNFVRLVPKATEVTTVASNATAVTNVSNNISAINTANSNATNVNIVATNIGNVNNVGNDIADVTTVANNLTGINAFNERYRVASSDPSSSLDAGDLVFNTSSNELKFYSGSSWNAVAAQDINVKVTGSDTGSGVLNDKLAVSGSLNKTVTNAGSNETLTLSVNVAEFYGFELIDTDSDGITETLRVTTTNNGADSITSSSYDGFDDKLFAPAGYTFSLNSSGNLIATL